MGGPWGEPIDYYEDGVIYWNYDPPADPQQDLAFITYYEEPLQPGEYTVSVNVTGANSTETLYGYNEATLTVVPVPIADIHLTGENVTLIHVNDPILEGDEVTIEVLLPNTGDAGAQNFLVNFSLDSEENVFDSQMVSLDPFSEDTYSSIWTAIAGRHTIIITADPTDVVSESLESNNNATVQFFVDGDNDGDGIGNISDTDDDNDGYPDDLEKTQGTDPLDELSTPPDNDADFTPDNLDPDDDNDGYGDDIEITVGTDPLDETSIPDDIDEDGIPDALDLDIDNDGIVNEIDVFPYDSTEWLDTDSDGTGNNADSDDDADGKADEYDQYPLDTDNDGMDNTLDWDDDADGIPDGEDARWFDTDNDGLRNDVDADDDGDGLSDEQEREKNTNPLNKDTDGDGVTDKADYDPLDSGITSEPSPERLYFFVPIIVTVILVLLAFISSRGFSLRRTPGLGGGYEELPEPGAEYEMPTEPTQPSAPPPPPGIVTAPSAEPKEDEFDELADLEEEFEEITIESKEKPLDK